MPTRKYKDTKTGEVVELLSDNFECSMCGYTEFDYAVNPEHFVNPRREMQYNRRCLNCGQTLKLDENLSDEKDRYVLIGEEQFETKTTEELKKKKAQGKEKKSKEQRKKEQSERMKKYWAKKKAEKTNNK